MSISKKGQTKRRGFASQQRVSALLIAVNVLALVVFLYILVNHQRSLGQAGTLQTPLQSCSALGGFVCMLGMDCPVGLVQASDAALCCANPCATMPFTKQDVNLDGVVDNADFELLVQNLGTAADQPPFNAALDLVPDGKITITDLAAWGRST